MKKIKKTIKYFLVWLFSPKELAKCVNVASSSDELDFLVELLWSGK